MRFLMAIAWLSMTFPAIAGAGTPLRDLLGEATTVRAAFEQEIYAETGELLESAKGEVVIKRPNQFRWRYDEPEQVIVADGKRILFFDVELDQLTITAQADALAGTPAALLGGGEEALAGFRLLDEFEANGLQWSRLLPLGEDPDFQRVSLGFSGTGELAAMELVDALGQQTRVSFTDYEADPVIDASAFELSVPDYVDVIDKTAVNSETP